MELCDYYGSAGQMVAQQLSRQYNMARVLLHARGCIASLQEEIIGWPRKTSLPKKPEPTECWLLVHFPE